MFNNIILSWLWRRVQEVGGWASVILPLYLAMPDQQKAVIHAILSGQGGGLSISAAIGLVVYLFSQWQSYRSTVKPQVITSDAKQIALPKASSVITKVEAIANSAPRPKTLWERLTGN